MSPTLPVSLPKPKNLTQSSSDHFRGSKQTPKPIYFSKVGRRQVERAILSHQLVSIYVENLPMEWSITEMYFYLAKFGDIVDIYVPGRLSKRGSRFGFVRYDGRCDVASIIDRLNRIQSSGSYLTANVARPRTNFQASAGEPRKVGKLPSANVPSNFVESTRKASGWSSFKEAVVGNKFGFKPSDHCNLSYSPLDEDIEWLKRCAVGYLSAPISTNYLQGIINANSNFPCSIKLLGGSAVLLEFSDFEQLSEFFHNDLAWTADYFELIKPWDASDNNYDRLCWEIASVFQFKLGIKNSLALFPLTSGDWCAWIVKPATVSVSK